MEYARYLNKKSRGDTKIADGICPIHQPLKHIFKIMKMPKQKSLTLTRKATFNSSSSMASGRGWRKDLYDMMMMTGPKPKSSNVSWLFCTVLFLETLNSISVFTRIDNRWWSVAYAGILPFLTTKITSLIIQGENDRHGGIILYKTFVETKRNKHFHCKTSCS